MYSTEKILLHKNLQNSSPLLKITITWRLIFENLQNSSVLLKITITIIFKFHFINVTEIFKILKKNSLQNPTINTEKVRDRKDRKKEILKIKEIKISKNFIRLFTSDEYNNNSSNTNSDLTYIPESVAKTSCKLFRPVEDYFKAKGVAGRKNPSRFANISLDFPVSNGCPWQLESCFTTMDNEAQRIFGNSNRPPEFSPVPLGNRR